MIPTFTHLNQLQSIKNDHFAHAIDREVLVQPHRLTLQGSCQQDQNELKYLQFHNQAN